MKLLALLAIFSVYCAAASADPLKWTLTETRLPQTVYLCTSVYDGTGVIYTIAGHNGTYLNDRVFGYGVATAAVEVNGQYTGIFAGTAIKSGADIYYFGGFRNGQRSNNISRYNTETGTHRVINYLPAGMYNAASAWNPDTRTAYLFGGLNGTRLDSVLQLDTRTNQIEQVASLGVGEGRERATAIFATVNSRAYLFGGETGSGDGTSYTDIFEFDPATRTVAKLAERLPQYVEYGCAVYARPYAYILHYNGLLRFNPETGRTEEVEVDRANWPLYLTATSCVYVPELGRIYVIGGIGRFEGQAEDTLADAISYIDLGGQQ